MRMRRIQAAMLAIALLCGCLAVPAAAVGEGNPFTDVSDGDPYYDAIMYCYERGIYAGVSETEFSPDGELTRAMFATLLGRVAENAGLNLSGYTQSGFTDVEDDSWYTKYVIWAEKKGIVKGTGSATFEPHASITREQAAAIVVRFAEVTYLELDSGGETVFTDLAEVSEWAVSVMDTAIAAGLAIGYMDGLLKPQLPATRAETADVLYRLCELYIGEKLPLIEILSVYVPIMSELTVNSYAPESFTVENGYTYYDDGVISASLGIDVSRYQGEIDWAKVKASGIEFAIIQVGFRGYGSSGSLNLDEYFNRNIQGALENGIDVGVYFFSQAITVEEAIQEADFVLNEIKDYSITYPVVFDWEPISGVSARTDGLGNKTLTDCAAAFCDTVAAAGYIPMVYSNQAVSLLRYDLSRLQGYGFWLAEYNCPPGFYYDFQIWQYGSNGVVDGIEGRVDMNLSFVNYAA